jgi:hypothetical protein
VNALVVEPMAKREPIARSTQAADGCRICAREDCVGIVGTIQRARARADSFERLSREMCLRHHVARAFRPASQQT